MEESGKPRVSSLIQDHLNNLAPVDELALRKYLIEHDLLRSDLQVSYDLYGSNPLARCMILSGETEDDDSTTRVKDPDEKLGQFDDELITDQLLTAKFIVEQMFKKDRTKNE